MARLKWGTSKRSRKHEDPERLKEEPELSRRALRMDFTALSVCWAPRALNPNFLPTLKSIPSRVCLRLSSSSSICYYYSQQSIFHQGGGRRWGKKPSKEGKKAKEEEKSGGGTGPGCEFYVAGWTVLAVVPWWGRQGR